jgi:hypothetical protein
MAAFVLGNGRSREDISIEQLLELGSVYGCNALYRTHAITALVATDQPIARAIQTSGYSKKHRFYTRRPLPNLGAKTVPKPYFGYSSGPIAVAIAAQDSKNPIYMLGFDMGPDHEGKFNNVYASTEFYKQVGAHPTFTGNWIKQIIKVVSDFSGQQFIRVKGATTADIPELNQLPNLQHIHITTFLERINNRKDL